MRIVNDKIIFIHVPKTGGTTITRILADSNGINTIRSFGQHTNPTEAKAKYDFDPTNYDLFAVRRNPWLRQASYYANQTYELRRRRPQIDKVKTVEEFFTQLHANITNNFIFMTSYQGKIHDRCIIIDFENLEEEVTQFWKGYFGIDQIRPPIQHENPPSQEQQDLKQEALENKIFQEIIAEKCKEEIDRYGYTNPTDIL